MTDFFKSLRALLFVRPYPNGMSLPMRVAFAAVAWGHIVFMTYLIVKNL